MKASVIELPFLIRAFGVNPSIVYYLQVNPQQSQLSQLLLKKLINQMDNPELSLVETVIPERLSSLRKLYHRALSAVKDAECEQQTEYTECLCKLGLGFV